MPSFAGCLSWFAVLSKKIFIVTIPAPPQINMYFEDITNPGQPKMAKVNKSWTLTQALKDNRYRVVGGTPCFVLVVAGSKFEKEYLKKYYN